MIALEEYFAAFDLYDDTQNEKRVEPKSANESEEIVQPLIIMPKKIMAVNL